MSLRLREKKPSEPHESPAPEGRAARVGEGGSALLCRACGFPITTVAARTERDGAHAHSRANPSGETFHFGCFAVAPGIVAIATPTTEASWFANYAWRIGLCGGCGVHLGWHFDGEAPFFGLILARLIEGEPPRA